MKFERGVSLKKFCTLNAGGNAENFLVASDVDELCQAVTHAHEWNSPLTILGSGSNMLPSDDGVPGLTIHNRASGLEIDDDGAVLAETGCNLQELFLKTVQRGFTGFEYAVGIPGTLGGALVSNAGAYRSEISEFIQELEIVQNGIRTWTTPETMEFSYRNSVLRQPKPPKLCVLRVRFQLSKGNPRDMYDEAREYQRQRISKQPPQASAGSFFKNVNDAELAARIPNLPDRLRRVGVVPAGFLIEHVGLCETRHQGAMFSKKHANFIVNVGAATATAIRSLAEHAKYRVLEKFGVHLEEEVLYLGDWSRYVRSSMA